MKAIVNAKGNITTAAKSLGVTRKTVYSWITEYDISDSIEEGRNTRLDLAESQLDKLIEEGNVTAIIFFLKTQGKERGYTERTEVESSGGMNITWEEKKTYKK